MSSKKTGKFMNSKKNIIIALCCALLVTGLVLYFRHTICDLVCPKPEMVLSSNSSVKGSDLFENLNGDYEGKGNLGEGKYSYKTLSDKYSTLKSLFLRIESNTTVLQDGKVMDSKSENQIFRYKSKFKLVVKSEENELYCDGKNVVRYIPLAKAYAKDKMSAEFFESMITSSPALNTIGLLTGADYSQRIKNYEFAGKEIINGKNCDIIKITLDGGGQVPDFYQKLWIEETDGIIVKNYYEISRSVKDENTGKNTEMVMKVSNLTVEYKFDHPIEDREFVFVPKKDDKEYDPVKETAEMERQARLMQQQKELEEARQAQDKPEENTPAVNTQMTEEERQAAVREEMKKNDPVDRQAFNFKASGFSPSAFKGQKLIVIFWAYGMGENYMNAVQSFARSNKNKYKIVTVNVNDKSKELKDYVNKNKYSVPVYYLDEKSSQDIVKKMGLYTLPSTYFIDEIGVVRGVLYGIQSQKKLESFAYEKLDRPATESVETAEPKEPVKETPGEKEINKEENEDLSVEITKNPPQEQQ